MNEIVVEELVDLVDSEGKIKERGVPRSRAKQQIECFLQIAIVIVFNKKGQVLVQKRSSNQDESPGEIDHICGAVSSGETAEQAGVREAFEETGVRLKNPKTITRGLNVYKRYRHLNSKF